MKSISKIMVKITWLVIFTIGISLGSEAWCIHSSLHKIPKTRSNHSLILNKIMQDEAMLIEEDPILEEWMFSDDFKLTEEAKEIENWMLDSDFWSIGKPAECEEAVLEEQMEIERWMSEFRVNYKNEKNIYYNIL